MYPPRAFSPRLVLLTSAVGSDVSVVVKHEVKLIWGRSNRQSLITWIYYFFQVIHFFFYIHLTELFAFVFISYYISLLLYFYFHNGYYCSLKLTFSKKGRLVLVIFHFIMHTRQSEYMWHVHILPKPHINVLYFFNETEKSCFIFWRKRKGSGVWYLFLWLFIF